MLVLASQSPRRKEILENAGIAHVVRVSGVPEEIRHGEPAVDYVRRLARTKAYAIERAAEETVLAADTVVVVDDETLEKPRAEDDAVRMLKTLSGRMHSVITGFCLVRGAHIEEGLEITRVHFVRMTEEEIRAYVATGEPADKAGAYAIQGLASKFIDRVEGCYFNVVGLPIAKVYRALKAL